MCNGCLNAHGQHRIMHEDKDFPSVPNTIMGDEINQTGSRGRYRRDISHWTPHLHLIGKLAFLSKQLIHKELVFQAPLLQSREEHPIGSHTTHSPFVGILQNLRSIVTASAARFQWDWRVRGGKYLSIRKLKAMPERMIPEIIKQSLSKRGWVGYKS